MTARSAHRLSGIISADQAFEQLGQERLEQLNAAVLAAWDRYRSRIAPTMGNPPATLRATAMQALMVEEMETRFGGDVARRRGRALLCAVPGLVVQMKKLNDRGMPSNYPTPTAIAFAAQLKIAGMPAGTRLTLGYLLNSHGTGIAEVRLLAQLGDKVAWSRAIGNSANQTVIPLMALPVAQPAHAALADAPKRRKLQPKGSVMPKKDRKPGA